MGVNAKAKDKQKALARILSDYGADEPSSPLWRDLAKWVFAQKRSRVDGVTLAEAHRALDDAEARVKGLTTSEAWGSAARYFQAENFHDLEGPAAERALARDRAEKRSSRGGAPMTTRAFDAAVKAHFEALTPKLDAALEKTARAKHLAETAFLYFEYDSPHFSETFAVRVWPMNAKGKPTAEGRAVLGGKAVAVPAKIYDAPEVEDLDPWQRASKLLERWFVTRWKVVRRATSSAQRAYIGHHDSFFKTDLQTGRRTDWGKIVAQPARRRASPFTP